MKNAIYVITLALAGFLLTGCASTVYQSVIMEYTAPLPTPVATPEPQEPEPIAEEVHDRIVSYENDENGYEPYSSEPYIRRAGEIITMQQLEELKEQAASWQAAVAGVSGVARIVAIEPLDGSGQKVYISFDFFAFRRGYLDYATYERIEVPVPEGAQARILSASSGAGSGEVVLGYKFVTDDSEWIEEFIVLADWLYNGYTPKWVRVSIIEGEIPQWMMDGVLYWFE